MQGLGESVGVVEVAEVGVGKGEGLFKRCYWRGVTNAISVVTHVGIVTIANISSVVIAINIVVSMTASAHGVILQQQLKHLLMLDDLRIQTHSQHPEP